MVLVNSASLQGYKSSEDWPQKHYRHHSGFESPPQKTIKKLEVFARRKNWRKEKKLSGGTF